VKFEVEGELHTPHACHCGQCRRQSGYFSVSTHAKKTDVKLTDETGLKWFKSSEWAQRGFCDQCGTSMFWEAFEDDNMYITVGRLDEASDLKLGSHIFVDQKPDHIELHDELPKFAGYDEKIE
jgi:hypothetical protein